MFRVTIKGKEEKSFDFPQYPKEVKHEQYIEFKWNTDKIQKFWSEKEKEGTEKQHKGQYLAMIAECLSSFTGEDLNDFYELPKGNVNEHFLSLLKATMDKYDNTKLEETLVGLYEHAFHAIATTKPTLKRNAEGYIFEHKGVQYVVPTIQIDAITGKDINPELSTGRAIEILERSRIAQQYMNSLDKDDIQRAAVEYEQDITILSLLAHKEGEVFPASQTGIDRWLSDRKKELSDISMVVGRDLCFFLRNSMRT